jgi:hypothetical protein
VRAHRWAKIDIQVQRLRADGCKTVLDLDKTKREEVLRLLRDGRIGKLLYAFLLANPKRTRKVYEDFRDALAKIEARGGSIKDVSTGLDTADKVKRTALLDVVRGQARRHYQGAKSAENGTQHKPGRKLVEFTPAQMQAAYRIWRDMVEYPTWKMKAAALREIVNDKGEEFTEYRARKEWGLPAKPKRKG